MTHVRNTSILLFFFYNFIASSALHSNKKSNDSINNGTIFNKIKWPEEWHNGIIPYVYNYFSMSTNRLIDVVEKGIKHLSDRSCLKFIEYAPDQVAINNVTYLAYSYSGALENCCVPMLYTYKSRRRLVLITPRCNLPSEVAHATLHSLGLEHSRGVPFRDEEVKSLLFSHSCRNVKEKMDMYNKRHHKI